MSKVSKDKKSEYNRAAYLKRKAKKLQASPEDKIEELILDDNIPDLPIPSGQPEPEELEISQDDYNKFLQWKNSQTNREETKKKLEDPSYLLTVLKTLGVALAPALIGVLQRAALKTLEQSTEIKSQSSIPQSAGIGVPPWDPLSAPN